ncbi:MAG: DUF2793 domain-containing protein [Hyphomicrobiaceae bacterium]|nr:MAG: DUF2793 domain-containing protein [Hyphomicrobiaceae bacterium]
MPSRALPGIGLNGFWDLGESGWKPGADTNWLTLSALTQLSVISRTTVLPGSPADGDIYIVRSDAGAEPNKVAVRDNGAWVYLTPQEGWRGWVRDTDELVVFNGTTWVISGGDIADDAVTNAKLANMASATIKGRISAGSGDPEDLTAAQVKTLLGILSGDISNFSESVDDRVATLLTAGANVSIVYDDVANTLTISASGGGTGGLVDGDYGDVTVSGGSTVITIDNAVVTNAKLANMATATFKGRSTAGTGAPEDLTTEQATALLNTFVGSGASHKKGLVPTPGATPGTTKFLREDGSWQVPASSNPTESIIIAVSDETTALTAGATKVTFRMPYAFTLTAVRASLSTAQSSGSILTVDINEGGASVLSTKLTIDNSEKSSTTAATAAVISDPALADDAEITIDIDQVGTGGAGLKVVLIGNRT